MIDHRQWHLWYHILENKKFDVKKITENIGSIYYCHKFDPFKCLVWRGLATPLEINELKMLVKHISCDCKTWWIAEILVVCRNHFFPNIKTTQVILHAHYSKGPRKKISSKLKCC